MKRYYAVAHWLLASTGFLWLCPYTAFAERAPHGESTLEAFESEMDLIKRAETAAEAGDMAGAARLLCTGGDPEKIGWRAITAAGHLRERDRYNEAERLAERILTQPGSGLADSAVREKNGRVRYWAARLYCDVLNRVEEAEEVLGTDSRLDASDSQIAEFRNRVRVLVTAKRLEKGGRP